MLYRELTCEALLLQTGNPCGELGIRTQWNRYDRLGWLASQHSDDSDLSDSLRYDASGNMTWRKQGLSPPKTFVMASGHNRLIQIVQAGSPTRSIVYDDAGSRVTEVDSAVYYLDRQYFYDALGRANGIFNIFDNEHGTNQPAGGIGMCRHDALGRQIKPCADGSPPLAFDGDNIIRALDWRVRHGPGLDDPLIALAGTGPDGPKELYYVTDGAGRHYAVAEGTGGLSFAILAGADAYAGYKASGAVTNSHSYGEARLSQPNAPGLSFFRHRVYDQETGRWTQEDPIGLAGGINLYQFNGNDPATYSDPYGLCPQWLTGSPCGGAVDFGAGFVPGVSTGVDVATALSGENPLTGEEVGLLGRGVALAGVLTPVSGGQVRGAGKALQRLTRKVGNIVGRHLDRRHLSIAARELRGFESGFDHVTEVREAAVGLRNVIHNLNGVLGNPNLDPALRTQAEQLLGRASRALDRAEDALRKQ